MSMQTIRSELGDYAKDIKLNLGSVLSEEGAPGLGQNRIFGIALASAYAVKDEDIVDAVISEAGETLSEAEIQAAKTAATLMAMNNIYYRFVHLASDKEFAKLPARLRMNAIASPGVEKVDFELYSLAVSVINGCGMCMDAHAAGIGKDGISREGIQSCVRIASVVNAVAQARFIG
jgi:alkyl hydroperoxide reductase subunit D